MVWCGFKVGQDWPQPEQGDDSFGMEFKVSSSEIVESSAWQRHPVQQRYAIISSIKDIASDKSPKNSWMEYRTHLSGEIIGIAKHTRGHLI
jgi:hypothetical protein